jgi:hypothetical protein
LWRSFDECSTAHLDMPPRGAGVAGAVHTIKRA